MTFYAFGFNHETAPVGVREVFALDREQQSQLYGRLELSEEAEVILLSTCNRTEVYLFGTPADVEHVREALSEQSGHPWPEKQSFLHEDEAAVRHVLQVTCGLRSLIIGDDQILSQVKEAYRLAVEDDSVITILHRLMHTAFRAAKSVARETSLAEGAASVSSAAVATAREFYAPGDGMQGARVVLLGAGRMGVLALEALKDDELQSLTVINRTSERAAEVAGRFGADVADWDERYAAVASSDLTIVATGADAPVINAKDLAAAIRETGRGGRQETLLIDIAVPRNVAPDVETLPHVNVCDLDQLNSTLVEVEEMRRSAIPAAETIVEDELSEFVTWYFHQQALQPAIHAVRDTFNAIRLEEIERHHHRFSEADRAELDRLTRSILQKVLAVPIVRLKEVDPESIDFVRGIKLLRSLFSRPGCEDDSARAAEESGDERSPEELLDHLRKRIHSAGQ